MRNLQVNRCSCIFTNSGLDIKNRTLIEKYVFSCNKYFSYRVDKFVSLFLADFFFVIKKLAARSSVFFNDPAVPINFRLINLLIYLQVNDEVLDINSVGRRVPHVTTR